MLHYFPALADLSIGRNANTGEFPAHAALYMPNNRFGEGVIINNNHVLTVAQNVFDPISNNLLAPNNITVRAGVINLGVNPPPLLNVIRIYAHEGYNRFTLVNNLAVIRVSWVAALEFLSEVVMYFCHDRCN